MIAWLKGLLRIPTPETAYDCPQCGKRTAHVRNGLWTCWSCFGYGLWRG